jgi:hypothetical protein
MSEEKESLEKWLEKHRSFMKNFGLERGTLLESITEKEAEALLDKYYKPKISRVEIIEQGPNWQKGRVYVHDPGTDEYDIEVAYQDNGRTLKVFITKKQ